MLAHRLIPTGETQMAHRSTADVVQDLLQRVRVPSPDPLRTTVLPLRRSLTTRGASFVGAAVVLLACGILLGQPDVTLASGCCCSP